MNSPGLFPGIFKGYIMRFLVVATYKTAARETREYSFQITAAWATCAEVARPIAQKALRGLDVQGLTFNAF